MKSIMQKHTIIELKLEKKSDREVNRITGTSRRIIAKYWKEYQLQTKQLENTTNKLEQKELQDKITTEPKYNSTNRTRKKYTEEIEKRLIDILKEEVKKKHVLGPNKQALTKRQIHEILKNEGYDISETLVSIEINKLRQIHSECFIRQEYEYADRLEYDFGEFKAIINGIKKIYYLAVMVSPASDYRWAYIYKNTKKKVFMDSQVKFFHQNGGIWKEIVYDNMKNVVTKFIGKNEKELNEDLIKLSLYYGFKINVTNCYSGNEKGSVEGGVKYIRNKIFAKYYNFPSEEIMFQYFESELIKLNEGSKIIEERKYLLPLKPKYELAEIKTCNVDTYSLIRVDNNFYSVPEYLVNKEVIAKIYLEDIYIYINNEFVCSHKKIDGSGERKINIKHYLNTFLTKPGALKNSLALKSIPELKSIYDEYYSINSEETKKFINIIKNNIDKEIQEIITIFMSKINSPDIINKQIESKLKAKEIVQRLTRNQTSMYNQMMLGRKEN